jgi:hypothetical protein
MVGSHEADDNRLTERVTRAPRARPTDHLPVVESGPAGEAAAPPEDDAAEAPAAVVPAEPEIETVTRLMGFLRNSDDG